METVNHPKHYQATFRGEPLEVIDVIEAFGLDFNLGNAVKYILRAGKKGPAAEDLAKARWYIERAIQSGLGPALAASTPPAAPSADEEWKAEVWMGYGPTGRGLPQCKAEFMGQGGTSGRCILVDGHKTPCRHPPANPALLPAVPKRCEKIVDGYRCDCHAGHAGGCALRSDHE